MKFATLLVSTMIVLFEVRSSDAQTERRMSYTGEWIDVNDPGRQSAAQPLAGYSKDSPSGYSKDYQHPRRSTQSALNQSAVRTNAVIKVYGVGRYVDPADCRIMHERHAVYRLEESAGWKLQPPANQPEILMGPIVGLRRSEYAPEPVRGEVGRDLIATKRNSQVALDEVNAVSRDQVKIRTDLEANLKRINQNEEALLGQFNDLKRQLEQAQAKSSVNATQPKPPPVVNTTP